MNAERDRVYRLVIRLTPGSGPRVSEVDEFIFSTRDVVRAVRDDIEPLSRMIPDLLASLARTQAGESDVVAGGQPAPSVSKKTGFVLPRAATTARHADIS